MSMQIVVTNNESEGIAKITAQIPKHVENLLVVKVGDRDRPALKDAIWPA